MIVLIILYVISAVLYLFIGVIVLKVAKDNGDKIEGWKNKAKVIAGFPFVFLGWLDPYGDK